jgi:hypothetical protein
LLVIAVVQAVASLRQGMCWTAKAEADSSAALRNDNQKTATAKTSKGKGKSSRRSFESLRSLRMTNFYFGSGFFYFYLIVLSKSRGSHGGCLCFDAGLEVYAGEG